ncbi:PREDICTED: uncharacterized protein LOC107331440 isoform X3 [Acropora digitifera]|uniref:uncharacterized protein LOC107331440 isoform X3 n=1 Tax=Acropora digitifera TaxID=70779 RepID=UPI00077B0529|nr:PREDICTED: uncharacterized protein LOC107331440 isoform X3 [Acropora digitifera]
MLMLSQYLNNYNTQKIAFISSSPKHLGYKPASPQQHDKTTALISALMGCVSLRFYREDAQENYKTMPKVWKENALNMNQVKGGQEIKEDRCSKPQDCEKYNRMKDLSHVVPTSTSQGSLTKIPHAGGFKESVPDINAFPKDFSGQPHRTEQKKANESARMNTLDNKDVQDYLSDTTAGKGLADASIIRESPATT